MDTHLDASCRWNWAGAQDVLQMLLHCLHAGQRCLEGKVCVYAADMFSLNLQPHPGPTSQHQLQAIHCRVLKKVQLTQLSPCLFIATHMMIPSPCLANVGPSHWVKLLHDRWLSPSIAISPPSRGASAQAALDNLHCHLHQGICVSRPPCCIPSAWAEQGPCSPDGTVLLPGPTRHPIIRGWRSP